MDFFEINQKWLAFILSLQLDSETKSHYASQITLINKISESGNLDAFLTNLKNVHTMKNDLSTLMLEYNNKKDIFKTEALAISDNYNFSFNYKEKEILTPIKNNPVLPLTSTSNNISEVTQNNPHNPCHLEEEKNFPLSIDSDSLSSESHMASIIDELDYACGGYSDVGSDYFDFEIEDIEDEFVFNFETPIGVVMPEPAIISIKEEKIKVPKKDSLAETKKDAIEVYFNSLLTGSKIHTEHKVMKNEKLTKSGIQVNSYLFHKLSLADMLRLFKKHNLTFDSDLLDRDLICFAAMPILNRMENLKINSYYIEYNKISNKKYLKAGAITKVFGSWSAFTEYLGIIPKSDVFTDELTIKKDSKIKLKSTNYHVYADFKNNLTPSQFVKDMNTRNLTWSDLSKNDIAYASILVLDNLKKFTTTAYNKQQQKMLGYLPMYIITTEFGGWLAFTEYIGLEYREPSKTKKEVKLDVTIKSNPQKQILPATIYNSFKIGLDMLADYNDVNSYKDNLDALKELDISDPEDFEKLGYKLYPSLLKVYEKLGTDNFMDSLDKYYLHFHKDFKTLPLNIKFKQLLIEYKKLGKPKTEFEFTKHFFSNGNSKTFIPLVLILDMFGSYADYLKLLINWESEQNN